MTTERPHVPSSTSHPRRWRVAILLALAAATTVAYAPAVGGGFHFDDLHTVVERVALRDLGAFVRSTLVEEYLSAGRPITDLTFAIDLRLFGLSPRAFHWTSIALHLAAVALAWLLARRLTARAGWRGEGLALFAAGVFALHPMQSQAVSYVSQRSEVLASLLFMSALLALLEADEPGHRRRRMAAGVAALALFALALGAKVIAVTLPLAYGLAVGCLGRGAPAVRTGRPWHRALLVAAPLAALSIAAGVRQVAFLAGRPDAGFDVPGLGPREYLLTQCRVVLAYLRLLAWPSGQNVDHELAVSRGLLEPATLAAALALALLVAGATTLVARARASSGQDAAASRLAGFGILWFLLILSPTSSVVPLADLIEEHRVYLASLGIALAAGAVASRALERLAAPHAARAAAALATVVLASLGVALHERNELWGSTEALWADAVRKSPTKARAHANHARELGIANKLPEALEEYRHALACATDGTVSRASVLGNMGPILLKTGRPGEALAALQEAREASAGDPKIETNLAVWYLEAGDLARAHGLASDAVRRSPQDGFARNILGVILLREGDARAARDQFLQSVAAGGRDVLSAAYNLAMAEERLGDARGACAAWARHGELATTDAARAFTRSRRVALGCR